jgi:hypothetical protein
VICGKSIAPDAGGRPPGERLAQARKGAILAKKRGAPKVFDKFSMSEKWRTKGAGLI